MSKLFLISEEEKNRILNLHEYAIKREMVSQKKSVKTLNEDMEALPEYEGVSLGKVEAVQQALVNLGYKIGSTGPNGDGVDGKFGEKTKAAVKKFQTSKNLDDDGIVGDNTAGALGVQPLYTKAASGSSSSSSGSGTSSGSATDSPFKTREEGNAFRKWMHKNFPNAVKKFDLNIEGDHTNKTIKNVYNSLPPNYTTTTYGMYYERTKGQTQSSQTQPKKDQLVVAPGLNPGVFKNINIAALDSTKSTKVCDKAGTRECASYINMLSDQTRNVGDAWTAHDNDSLGTRIKTAYHGLTPAQTDKIFNIFKAIQKSGGPTDNGPQTANIKALQTGLVPKISASDLKPGDYVGIYYPGSLNHEKALYNAALFGKGYFIKDSSGQYKKGNSISKGTGFGLNTHIGMVGFEKNGVPLIIHNYKGTVYSDPWDKIKGGGKIMWIRRPS
jgi:peptidoglycan hydrolase-like protein with peptidoglycan-binding domain